jgi:hypothetical protein
LAADLAGGGTGHFSWRGIDGRGSEWLALSM